jgi:23S rRNA (uracil1939-C5)-methyltransferase
VSTGDDGQAIVIVHYIGQSPDVVAEYLVANRALIPSASGICLQHGRKNSLIAVCGVERLYYSVPGGADTDLRLAFSRGGFSQVNFRQNRHLISLVNEMAGLSGTERVLDLYCGNGNFSLPLALRAGEVIGIEGYAPSIEDAQRNAEENSIHNARFYCADAAEEVQQLSSAGELFDIIVLDPPRTGAAQLVRHLPSLGARRIIYVSCDPVTLARDIAIIAKFDYRVVHSVPVDMFPHTYHIESVTLLERL